MAIRRLNTTIQPMNDKLGTLVSADLPSGIFRTKNVTAIAFISHFIFHKNRGILFMR